MADEDNSFEKEARQSRSSLIAEFIHFLREEKKWWLAPILIVMALVAALVLLAGHGAAPFIYTLF